MVDRNEPLNTDDIGPDGSGDSSNEAFPCPNCGQMLGPAVRVCASCREPVDFELVRSNARAAASPPEGGTPAEPRAPVPRSEAQFSWRMFFTLVLVWLLTALLAQRQLGEEGAQSLMLVILIFSSAWVTYDARQRGVPKPLRWGVGSLLVWIVVFPWYLSRRRTPGVPCALVEGPAPGRILLVMVVAILLLGLLAHMFKAGAA
jgi:hypothetical protein